MPDQEDSRRSTHPSAAVEIQTDVNGFVVEAPDAAETTFAVSSRTLQQRSVLSFFPGDHAQIQREMVMVSLGHEPKPINAMLYPRDRARVPVTVRLASPEPSTIVWSITRRAN
jgi:hypothetical protein